MMAIYNTTNLTSADNFLEFTQAINTTSENWFGIMFYLAILVIFFVALKRSRAEDNVILAATAWFGLIFAVILKAVQLIPAYFIILAVVLTILTTGLLWAKSNSSD